MGWVHHGSRVLSFLVLLASLVGPLGPAQALHQDADTDAVAFELTDVPGTPAPDGVFDVDTDSETRAAADDTVPDPVPLSGLEPVSENTVTLHTEIDSRPTEQVAPDETYALQSAPIRVLVDDIQLDLNKGIGAGLEFIYRIPIINDGFSSAFVTVKSSRSSDESYDVPLSGYSQAHAAFSGVFTPEEIARGEVLFPEPGIVILDYNETVIYATGPLSLRFADPAPSLEDISLGAVDATEPRCDEDGYHPPRLLAPDDTDAVTYGVDPVKSTYSPGDVVTIQATWDPSLYEVSDFGDWKATPDTPGTATRIIEFRKVDCDIGSLLVEIEPSPDTYTTGSEVIEYVIYVTNTGPTAIVDITLAPESADSADTIARLGPDGRELIASREYIVTEADLSGDAGVTLTASVIGTVEGTSTTITASAERTIPYAGPRGIALDVDLLPWITQARCTEGGFLTPPTLSLPIGTDEVAFAVSDSAPYVPGQTITLLATAQGTSYFSTIPSGWEIDESVPNPTQATYKVIFDDVPCGNPGLTVTMIVIDEGQSWRVGSELPYQITLRNSGTIPLADITVEAPRVSNLACDGAPPDRRNLVPALAPSDGVKCTATHVITQADFDGGSEFTTTASATAITPAGETISSEGSATVTLVPAAPSLDVVETHRNQLPEYEAGQVASSEIAVANNGNVTLSEIAVTNSLAGSLVCSGTSIAPGKEITCVADYTITPEDISLGAPLVSLTTVTATAPDGTTITGKSPPRNIQLVTGSPRLALAASVSPTTVDVAGQEVAFTFQLTNTGTMPLTSLAIDAPALAAAERAVMCEETALAPGETTTCTATSTVSQADIDGGGEIEIIATASGRTSNNRTASSNQKTLLISIDQHPDLSLESVVTHVTSGDTRRTVESGEPVRDLYPGDVVTYRIAATNSGNVSLPNVTVSAQALNELRCDETEPLAPGHSRVCTASYTLTDDDPARWRGITHPVEATAEPAGRSPLRASASTTIWPAVPAPALTITETIDRATYDRVGDEIAYTVTVRNMGLVPISDFRITNTGAPEALDCGKVPETLEPDQDVHCTGIHTIAQADLDAGSVVSKVTATGKGPDGTTVEAADTVTATAVQRPKIAFTTAVSDVNGAPASLPVRGLELGDVLTYTHVVANTGNVTLAGASVTHSLAGSSDLICDQPVAVPPGTSLTCTATYSITHMDIERGVVANEARASAIAPDGRTLDGQAEVSARTVDPDPRIELRTSVTPDVVHRAGETVTWSFVVTNTGNVTITDVTVSDPRLAERNIPLTCPEEAITPNDSLTCTASLKIPQLLIDYGDPIPSEATATGMAPEGISAGPRKAPVDPRRVTSNQAEATVTIVQAPSLALEVTVSTPPGEKITVGTVMTWQFTVTNTGNMTLRMVTVGDDVVSWFGGSGLPAGADLAPGEARSLTSTARVLPEHAAVGKVVNNARATDSVGRASITVPYTLPLDEPARPTPTPRPTEPARPTPTPTPTVPARPSPTPTPTPQAPEPAPTATPTPQAPSPAPTITPTSEPPAPIATLPPASETPGIPVTPTPAPDATPPSAAEPTVTAPSPEHEAAGSVSGQEPGAPPDPADLTITELPSTGQPGTIPTGPGWFAALLAAMVLFGSAVRIRRNRVG